MDVDFSDLNALAADLGEVAEQTPKLIRKAVEVTSRNVKDSAKEKVQGRKHLGHAAAAIDYEMMSFSGFGATVLQSEVGYNKGKAAGKLGVFVEFGAPDSTNSLAPGSELQEAIKDNAEDFERGLSIALEDGLKAAGL